jgi:phospholipid/cholesterol/gamma-HCH transport system ATP-binding protein
MIASSDQPLSSPELPVVMRGLLCGYQGVPVVQALSLQIQRGEILVVAGRSGCGKTTVLRTVAGLLPPVGGVVEVLGLDLWSADLPQRRPVLRRIGLLFQGGALLGSLSVADNLLLPVQEHVGRLDDAVAKRLVDAKLAQVGLAGTGGLAPSELSGGMRKRVALARALMLDPELLLCDEPTSGLDPVVAAGIDDLVLELRARLQMAMVVISHDLDSIRRIADRVLLLHDGQPVALGSVAELEASQQPVIYDFFHRESPIGGFTGETLGSRLGVGGPA